ncbi:MAG TPA: GNAT family N-acetyltransferase [Gammaproteobacteria bacterium]|jgi:CelD/BcsL family acetyltransferase involved in cellulose biosynthesis
MEGHTNHSGRGSLPPIPGLMPGITDFCETHPQPRTAQGQPDPETFLAWSELAARSKAPPYLHPGWLRCWWPAFGVGELEIKTLWQQGQLTAALPLGRRSGQLESTANFHTPVFGITAANPTAATSMARELFRDAPARVSLSGLDPDGTTLKVCKDAAEEAGFNVITRPHLLSPFVGLEYGWNEYKRNLHSHLLRNLRRGRKQLEEQGKLVIENVSGEALLDARLDEALDVEASGWKGKMGTAILSQPHTRDFYREMAHWAAERGVLRLYLLRLSERVLTMCLTLQQHGVCYMLKGGYDENFKRYSPGNILTAALIEDCANRGITRVEIYGEAEAYKLNWATGTRQFMRLEAFAPTVAGRLALASYRYSRPITSRVRQALKMQQPGHRQ